MQMQIVSGFYYTLFVLIATLPPVSTHLSYFEVINDKIKSTIYPRSIHKAYILSYILLGINLKLVKIIIIGWSLQQIVKHISAHPKWFI